MTVSTNLHILSRAVIIDNNQILLCKPSYAVNNKIYYYLPGGHVEHGEGVHAALIRELDEETSFKFVIDRFLGCLEYSFVPTPGAPNCHNQEYNFIFLAHSQTMKAGILPSSKDLAAQLEWVPYDALSKILFYPEPMPFLISQWLSLNYDGALQSSMNK